MNDRRLALFALRNPPVKLLKTKKQREFRIDFALARTLSPALSCRSLPA
jgi:hypothetical protein